MQQATPVSGLTETVLRFLKALASESRQQVMLLLTDGAELTVGEVARCWASASRRPPNR